MVIGFLSSVRLHNARQGNAMLYAISKTGSITFYPVCAMQIGG